MPRLSFFVADKEFVVHGVRNDSGAHDATKVCIHGRHLSYLSPTGKMFSTRVGHQSGHYGRRWHGHAGLIADGVKLGLLPKKVMEKLLAREAVHRKKQGASYAANNVDTYAKQAGITLTAEQKRQIKKLSAYKGRRIDW